jgi:hypothetical protein
MDATRRPGPAAALLAVALVWTLLLAARAPGARGPEADAALLVGVCGAAATLLALRPPGRATTPRSALLAAAAGFASLPLLGAALAAVASALGLGPAPVVRPPGPALAVLQLGPGPLLEELLYRERLLGSLRPRLGAPAAVAVSSAVFAVAHPEPWSGLGALGVGLALGALFAATGSLALAVAAHAGLNTALCLLAWTRG